MQAFLKVYGQYSANYAKNLQLLQETLNEKKSPFKTFLEGVPKFAGGLEAYLIQPVQRIPRYRLLLEDLLKHTDRVGSLHTSTIGAQRLGQPECGP